MNNSEKKYLKREKHNRTGIQKLMFGIVFSLLFLYGLSLIYTFLWSFFAALKTNSEYFSSSFELPKEWLFGNFAKAFKELVFNETDMIGMTLNSVWFTLGTTFAAIMVSSMTAYVVAKYKFFGRNFIYSLAIFIMIIPIVGSLPSAYKLFYSIGIADSPLIILAYAGGFGFNFIVLYGFFRSLPWSYAEAAFVDGASDFKVFHSIMLPMAKPTILAVGLIQAIGMWNDYMTPILYLPNHITLSAGLFYYQTIIQYKANYPMLFAGILISTVPILVLFIAFQNTIMENTSIGGLKG